LPVRPVAGPARTGVLRLEVLGGERRLPAVLVLPRPPTARPRAGRTRRTRRAAGTGLPARLDPPAQRRARTRLGPWPAPRPGPEPECARAVRLVQVVV